MFKDKYITIKISKINRHIEISIIKDNNKEVIKKAFDIKDFKFYIKNKSLSIEIKDNFITFLKRYDKYSYEIDEDYSIPNMFTADFYFYYKKRKPSDSIKKLLEVIANIYKDERNKAK